MKTKKTKPLKDAEPVSSTKFRYIMLVSMYRFAKLGVPEFTMAEELGISKKTWYIWKKKYPQIDEAIKMGQTDTKDGGNWHKFVYDRLPDDIKAIWNKISEWDEQPNGIGKIETLLETHGKGVRQQLYLYALVNTNFSPSRAMSKVNIDKDTLDYWIQNDPDFAELVEQIQWHKDNFFEDSFIQLIRSGSEAATIHAAKSRLRNRGYGIKSEVEVNHSGQIEHNLFDLTEIMPYLTDAVKMAIMDAMRQREERIAAEKSKDSIPAEFKVLGNLSDDIATVPEETAV